MVLVNTFINIVKKLPMIIMLEFIFLVILILLNYYTQPWFAIKITIVGFNLNYKTIMYLTIVFWVMMLLQQYYFQRKNEFVVFFFWVLVLLNSFTYYYICIQAFYLLENVKEILLDYSMLKAEIIFTKSYKMFFAEEYLKIIYPKMTEKSLVIGEVFFDKQLFMTFVERLHFIPGLKDIAVISEIKTQCQKLIVNYTQYRMRQAEFLISLYEDELFYDGFLYNLFTFFPIMISVLLFPAIATEVAKALVVLTIKRLFPKYIMRKAMFLILRDITIAIRNYPHAVHINMTPIEILDLTRHLARILLRNKGVFWVYKQR